MKCWLCDQDARGTCAACGRALCPQHAHIHDEMTLAKTDTVRAMLPTTTCTGR